MPDSSPFDPAAWGPAPTPPAADPAPRSSRPRAGRVRLRRRRRPAGWGTPPRPRVRPLVHLAAALALGVGITVATKTWALEPFTVPSASMAPTLADGDTIAVEKLTYVLGQPLRGQVVVFDGAGTFHPRGRGTGFYVKRVVAVAGDTVRCCDADGRLLVNDTPVLERYLPQPSGTAPFDELVVPDGHVFVLGDNRGNSADSRVHGPVPVDAVVGRVLARVRPWHRIGPVDRG